MRACYGLKRIVALFGFAVTGGTPVLRIGGMRSKGIRSKGIRSKDIRSGGIVRASGRRHWRGRRRKRGLERRWP